MNHHPGFKKHLLVLAASTLFVVLIYTLFPVCAQRDTAPDRADCFADHIIIQRGSFTVAPIVDCTICTDSELTCGLYCVNISTKEQKLPSVFRFLPLDHGIAPPMVSRSNPLMEPLRSKIKTSSVKFFPICLSSQNLALAGSLSRYSPKFRASSNFGSLHAHMAARFRILQP